MTGKHWFRKDILVPIFNILVISAGLFWLRQKLLSIPATAQSDFVRLALKAVLVIYVIWVLITIRHILSTYDLERYDPGDPVSLKRLMRRHRFRLHPGEIPDQALPAALEQGLLDARFRLEAESHMLGRIYRRRQSFAFLTGHVYDRVFILQHESMNVLMVDQLLQDCMRYIRLQADHVSRRNLLILVTGMADTDEAASAAAGVVNFLGKFQGGTLCPLLLATKQNRFFYPADRTLMPVTHRFFQNCLKARLKKAIRGVQREANSPSK